MKGGSLRTTVMKFLITGQNPAKIVTARLARSDPQARITISSGDTPIKNQPPFGAVTLKGVWGGRIAANEVQTEPPNKNNRIACRGILTNKRYEGYMQGRP